MKRENREDPTHTITIGSYIKKKITIGSGTTSIAIEI
jgi:hypothetical protein